MAKKPATPAAKKAEPIAPATVRPEPVEGQSPEPPQPAGTSAPAPETTQQQAGAGETQDQPVSSGANGPDPVIGLRITAAVEGFRRAGRAWGKQPAEIPVVDLDDYQLKLLQEEHGKMLTVEEIVLS